MARFPLPFIPGQNYRYGGIRFGAQREDGARHHAGCDLIARPGTPVLAIDWGIVIRIPETPFIKNTKLYSVVVEHNSFIARYGEVERPTPDELYVGKTVHEGDLISYIARNNRGGGMLHLELYSKDAGGEYYQPYNKNYLNVETRKYKRRADLLDPTPFLDQWAAWTDWSQTNAEDWQ